MDESEARIRVHLTCAVTKEEFACDLPRNATWLGKYWSKKTKIRCRVCGGAHSFLLRERYLAEVLAPQTAE
jgi:ribosomal protein L37E